MKQEDKELLLKDLCSRLPYGVKVEITHWRNRDKNMIDHKILCVLLDINKTNILINTTIDVKPYLLPLSSMTEEQKQYLKNRFCYDWDGEPYELWKYQIEIGDADELIDWFNKNHLDYRNLIEKGLALDATGLNIY
jgi:hypothetical protein